MTNTQITDPEVLATRYPVRLEHFSIRPGAGGKGVYQGGDGLIRHYRFLRDVQVSLMTQRRETVPFGLAGGEPGVPGKNRRVTPQGAELLLAHAVSYEAQAGRPDSARDELPLESCSRPRQLETDSLLLLTSPSLIQYVFRHPQNEYPVEPPLGRCHRLGPYESGGPYGTALRNGFRQPMVQ